MKIHDIREFVTSMPKTINEAMEYGGNGFEDDKMMDPEMEPEIPQGPAQQEGGKMDVMAFVDEIRKKSLKGMAELADTPEDPLYEILKRIWQTCDKAYNDQRQPNGGQQQQPQGGRPM